MTDVDKSRKAVALSPSNALSDPKRTSMVGAVPPFREALTPLGASALRVTVPRNPCRLLTVTAEERVWPGSAMTVC